MFALLILNCSQVSKNYPFYEVISQKIFFSSRMMASLRLRKKNNSLFPLLTLLAFQGSRMDSSEQNLRIVRKSYLAVDQPQPEQLNISSSHSHKWHIDAA